MAVRSWHGIVTLLLIGSISACGSSATPSPSPSASPTPAQSVAAPTSSPTVTEPPSASPVSGTQIYVVKKNDTLIGIAKRFHISLAALRAANPKVTDPTKLKIGMKLVIPGP